MTSTHAVTRLLIDWREGNASALEELTPLVYEELRLLAHRHMASENAGHTLQATGLVNEVFVRLADADISWQDRAHFFALAARLMRRILIDHARTKNSAKRGSGRTPVTLDESYVATGQDSGDIILLDDALTKLASFDERKSDIVVLHYFGGLSYDETAAALDISAATVHRELRLAKAWLLHELQDD